MLNDVMRPLFITQLHKTQNKHSKMSANNDEMLFLWKIVFEK